jgi:hypothetical protein
MSLVALPLLLAAPKARAYEERWTLGAELGAGVVVVEDSDLPQWGGLVGLTGSLGLDDIWSVRGHLAWAFHPGDQPLHVGIFGAEIVYLLDIVEFVPFFGAGLDGLFTLHQGSAGMELGAHAVIGIDYLWSRDLLFGLDIRPHLLPLSIEEARLDPVYVTANLRASLLFDTY